MIDIGNEIEAVHRAVAERRIAAGDARSLLLRRTLDAPIEDVWDALTNPERIGRWFLPVTGDYRVGGRFQFEGNAGGQIVACERPHLLHVTWGYSEMGGDAAASDLEVRLSMAGDEATILELEHTAMVPDEMWSEYGPGAVGVGWDLTIVALAEHLETGEQVVPDLGNPDALDFMRGSSDDWCRASIEGGTPAEEATAAAARTAAAYTGG